MLPQQKNIWKKVVTATGIFLQGVTTYVSTGSHELIDSEPCRKLSYMLDYVLNI